MIDSKAKATKVEYIRIKRKLKQQITLDCEQALYKQ